MLPLSQSVFYLSASFSTFVSIAATWLAVPSAIAQAPLQPITPATFTQSLNTSESASDLPAAQSLTPIQRQLLEAAVEAAEKVKQEELLGRFFQTKYLKGRINCKLIYHEV